MPDFATGSKNTHYFFVRVFGGWYFLKDNGIARAKSI